MSTQEFRSRLAEPPRAHLCPELRSRWVGSFGLHRAAPRTLELHEKCEHGDRGTVGVATFAERETHVKPSKENGPAPPDRSSEWPALASSSDWPAFAPEALAPTSARPSPSRGVAAGAFSSALALFVFVNIALGAFAESHRPAPAPIAPTAFAPSEATVAVAGSALRSPQPSALGSASREASTENEPSLTPGRETLAPPTTATPVLEARDSRSNTEQEVANVDVNATVAVAGEPLATQDSEDHVPVADQEAATLVQAERTSKLLRQQLARGLR